MEYTEFVFSIVLGTVIGFGIYLLPDKAMLKIGRYLSPCMISIIHTPMALFGYFYLYELSLFLAFEAIVFAAILDTTDGKVARAFDTKKLADRIREPLAKLEDRTVSDNEVWECAKKMLRGKLKKEYADKLQADYHLKWLKAEEPTSFWTSLFYRGGSEWGKKIDPFMDKLAITPIFGHIAFIFVIRAVNKGFSGQLTYALITGAFIIVMLIGTEITGTVIRLDYFSHLLGGVGATWIGKTKALSQWLFIIPFMPFEQNWISENWIVNYVIFLNIVLGSIFVLAIWSIKSKFKYSIQQTIR